MIQGPTMWRANANRTANEQTTIAASHTHAGAAASRLRTEPDLAQPRRDQRDVGEADLGRGPGDTEEHLLVDGVATRRQLEGGCVRVRDASEVVLAGDVRARGGPQLPAVVGGHGERREEDVDLVLVDRHLQDDVVGE